GLGAAGGLDGADEREADAAVLRDADLEVQIRLTEDVDGEKITRQQERVGARHALDRSRGLRRDGRREGGDRRGIGGLPRGVLRRRARPEQQKAGEKLLHEGTHARRLLRWCQERISSMRTLAFLLLFCGQDYKDELPRLKPTEAADAVKTFKLADGYRIELVAAEP